MTGDMGVVLSSRGVVEVLFDGWYWGDHSRMSSLTPSGNGGMMRVHSIEGATAMKDRFDARDRTSGASKLTAGEVRAYRARYERGDVSVRGIAAMHEMSTEAVRRMLRRETWAWVKDEVGREEVMAAAGEMEARLLVAMKREGEVKMAAVEVQVGLGIELPASVIAQAEMLTGRKVGEDVEGLSELRGEGGV